MTNGFLQSIAVGLGGLRINLLRTILSTLGVIIGVASLVAILSIGDSLEQFSRNQITETTDLQTIQVSSVTAETVDGIRVKLEDVVRLSAEDLADLNSDFGDRALIVPAVISSVRVSVVGDTVSVVSLLMETRANSLEMVPEASVIAGRFFDDVRSQTADIRPVVLTEGLASRLSPESVDNIIGKVLLTDSTRYSVVGVVKMRGGDRARMFTSIDGNCEFGRADLYPTIAIRPSKIETVESMAEELKGWLDNRFGGSSKFTIATSMQRVQQLSRAMLIFKLGLGAIAAISLIVGGIGIMNVLLASVAERTREIGVRKATGAKRSDILVQFLAESVGITGVGAIAGVLLGLGVSAAIMLVISRISDAPIGVSYTWVSVLLAAVASIVIGLIFGTFPALRASRLSPVDAIRHE